MRKRRGVVVAALVACAGSVVSPLTAQAAAGAATFYVNNKGVCSDATSASVTTPYCTIQAAVNAAIDPGDTVEVAAGSYAPFTVAASGTSGDPITIEGIAASHTPWAAVTTTSTSPAVSVQGASYVNVEGFLVNQYYADPAFKVEGSSHVVLNGDTVNMYASNPDGSIVVGSGSTNVTISRNVIYRSDSTAAAIGVQGGTGDVITTNIVSTSSHGPGISLNGSTNADITSNDVIQACGEGIEVVNGSTSASIENNLALKLTPNSACATSAGDSAELLVDSTSAPGTTADYNNIDPQMSPTDASGDAFYSWAGKAYGSASSFSAATGQGAHDLSAFGASAIDDANSDAPGELAPDASGNPEVDDPDVPNTGAGTYAYYDREAASAEDPVTVTEASNWPTQMPAATTVTFSATVASGWSSDTITSCVYDFEDGTPAVTVTPVNGICATPHSYSAAGNYSGRLIVAVSDGYQFVQSLPEKVVATNTQTPSAAIYMVAAREAWAVFTGSDSWNLAECRIDFGDGTVFTSPTSQIGGGGCNDGHIYTNVGSYKVTLTVTDVAGNTLTSTGTLRPTGFYYTPLTPVRVLDTRHGTGAAVAKVAAGTWAKLKLAGVDGVPQGAAAAVLTVTATDATAGSFVSVYPDGGSRPSVSNLNLTAGETVANTVIAEIGSDGYIDLYNGGTRGSIDLIADLQGYYAVDGDAYTALTQPTRALDSRKSTAVPAGGTVKVNLGTYSGITAAVLNLTVTGSTANGLITAYPDGAAIPTASNLNYGTAQTIADEAVVKVGSDGYVDFTNTSRGTVELIVDVNGYFGTDSSSAFVPVTPTRVYDSRTGVSLGGGTGRAVPIAEPDNSVSALALNVTATQPTKGGFLLVYPIGYQRPATSTVNFSAGVTIANAATVGDFDTGGATVYNGGLGTTQFIVDVFGYYSG